MLPESDIQPPPNSHSKPAQIVAVAETNLRKVVVNAYTTCRFDSIDTAATASI